MKTIRTRIAPSPTGMMHLGTARTAIYCWAVARHFGGKFLLRIEDTDQVRSTKEAVQVILDGMKWLNLDYSSATAKSSTRCLPTAALTTATPRPKSSTPCAKNRRPRASSPAMTVAGVLRTVRASPSPKV